MQNGFYEVRVPDATDYWMEMVKCRTPARCTPTPAAT
jgi:hypothetical protein